jgi:Glycosyl transferase family 2/F5/8 type C domain
MCQSRATATAAPDTAHPVVARLGRSGYASAMPRHRYSIVACARWEEACIQEWLEYHRSIGFDHVYLYSNDDDPIPLAKVVAPYLHGAKPFVTLRHWPEVGAQIPIYLHFLETFKDDTEWFAFLDIDEFLVLKGVNNVYGFMLDYRNTVDCLYFHWVIYGNNGKVKRDDAPVLTSYTRRAIGPSDATKMLCRSAAISADLVRSGNQRGRGAFWHFLDNYQLPGVRCRDVLHHSMDGYSAALPDSPGPFVKRPGFAEAVLDRAYVAHFQFKSEEDFLRRWQRGGFDNGEHWKRLFESGRYRDLLAETNAVTDTYLADYWSGYTEPVTRFLTVPTKSSRAAGNVAVENVALHKPSSQSSVYQPAGAEPLGSSVSGAGNNGRRTGRYGFHTNHEAKPWWMVDLLASYDISEIHIYNRMDSAGLSARARALDVLCSLDGETWETIFENPDDVFGLDGRPLALSLLTGGPYRFVMLRLRTAGILHLDEVEVYGTQSDQRIEPANLPDSPAPVAIRP